MRIFIAFIACIAWVSEVQAVTMSEAFKLCYSDGREWCPNLGHGSRMQDCLNLHFKQLSPSCQKIVIRLNEGEKITLF
jgi:hypothetical protein